MIVIKSELSKIEYWGKKMFPFKGKNTNESEE